MTFLKSAAGIYPLYEKNCEHNTCLNKQINAVKILTVLNLFIS